MFDPQSASIFAGQPSAPSASRRGESHLLAEATSGSVVNLAPFLSLARELASSMIPVQLRQEFRDELHRELMAAARQQYAYDLLLFPSPATNQGRNGRRWVLGAATFGSAVSLVGVAAYVWLHRHRQAA
jgi:hypothetical protein